MKSFIITLLVLIFLSGCATRRKVLFNKQTGDRWITVDNASEFLTEKEKEFLKVK